MRVTPRLVLEGNALARRLGWPFAWATLLLAVVPYLDVGAGIILTASWLVTTSNLSRGWSARTLGEEENDAMLLRVARRSRRGVALSFVMGSAASLALLGFVFIGLSAGRFSWPHWSGLGILAYALAVAVHGATSVVRIFRAAADAPSDASATAPRNSPPS